MNTESTQSQSKLKLPKYIKQIYLKGKETVHTRGVKIKHKDINTRYIPMASLRFLSPRHDCTYHSIEKALKDFPKEVSEEVFEYLLGNPLYGRQLIKLESYLDWVSNTKDLLAAPKGVIQGIKEVVEGTLPVDISTMLTHTKYYLDTENLLSDWKYGLWDVEGDEVYPLLGLCIKAEHLHDFYSAVINQTYNIHTNEWTVNCNNDWFVIFHNTERLKELEARDCAMYKLYQAKRQKLLDAYKDIDKKYGSHTLKSINHKIPKDYRSFSPPGLINRYDKIRNSLITLRDSLE